MALLVVTPEGLKSPGDQINDVVRRNRCFSKSWTYAVSGGFGVDYVEIDRDGPRSYDYHFLVFPETEYTFESMTTGRPRIVKRYPGQVVFLPAHTILDFRLLSGEMLFSAAVIPHGLLEEVAGKTIGELSVLEFEDDVLRSIASTMRQANDLSIASSAEFTDSMLRALAARLWSCYEKKLGIQDATPTSSVSAAMQFARQNLGQSLTLQDMADASAFSSSQLNRLFNKECGMGAMAWLRMERLGLAVRLLERTDLTVEGIAHRVGFADGPHLTRLFKARFGVSPAHHRRKAK